MAALESIRREPSTNAVTRLFQATTAVHQGYSEALHELSARVRLVRTELRRNEANAAQIWANELERFRQLRRSWEPALEGIGREVRELHGAEMEPQQLEFVRDISRYFWSWRTGGTDGVALIQRMLSEKPVCSPEFGRLFEWSESAAEEVEFILSAVEKMQATSVQKIESVVNRYERLTAR